MIFLEINFLSLSLGLRALLSNLLSMRRIVLLLIAVCFGSLASFAQMSKGGRPDGFKFYPVWESAELQTMPAIDTKMLMAEDERDYKFPGKALRFGVAHTTDITPDNSGSWHTLPSGDKIWMLRVKSTGAYSLSLGFNQLDLPEGGRLFIYNKDRSTILGAFTSELKYADHTLATEQLVGDEIMVEYDAPANDKTIPFHIARVSHDYRNVQQILKAGLEPGTSGACQRSVNCFPEYQLIKRSIVAVLAGGTKVFSGGMINTTNNSGIPYMLTAYHCYEVNPDPANWIFRFNWEIDCNTPPAQQTYQSLSGASLRALSKSSDMCLVRLTQTPGSATRVIYAGWDRRNIPTTQTICISHPMGDRKMLARAPGLVTTDRQDNGSGDSIDCWKSAKWDIACPEKGSSGAPMFNKELKIVGQLFGGPSYCDAPDGIRYDYFGKFSVSWDRGSSSAERLKDWLDPYNTGVDSVGFYDPNDAGLVEIINPSGIICDPSVKPQVIISNNGAISLTSLEISYAIDNQAPKLFTWTGTLNAGATTSVTLPVSVTTIGTHDLKAFVSKPNGLDDNNPGNDVLYTSFELIDGTIKQLPLLEDFEQSTFPSQGWSVINPNPGSIQWKRFILGTDSTNTACVKMDNYNRDTEDGNLDHLITPFLDFRAVADYTLSFKVAHARYNAQYIDHLQVFVTTDCENTWTKVYDKSSTELTTVAQDVQMPFLPKSTEWRTDSINLNAYKNNPRVKIRFTNVKGVGNHVYLDDIHVTQKNALPITDFMIERDTVCAGNTLPIKNKTTGAQSYTWNSPGATPPSSIQDEPQLSYDKPGVYYIDLKATNASGSQNMTKQVVVVSDPDPVVSRYGNTLSVSNSKPYVTYQWYKNGVAIPGATAATVAISSLGEYTVAVSTSYGCDGQSVSLNINKLIGIDNDVILMLPNPARDYIDLVDTRPDGTIVQVMIFNAIGQVVYQGALEQSIKKQISLHGLPAAVYNVRLSRGEAISNKKLVIQ